MFDRFFRPTNLMWLAAWLALMAAVTAGMYSSRQWLIVDLSSPETRAQWDEFRQSMRDEADRPGPVRHAVPKSPEPPLLVLLRDYFAVCLAAVVFFVSAIFFVLAVFIRGSLSIRAQPPSGEKKSERA